MTTHNTVRPDAPMHSTLYKIPAPYSATHLIIVYGDTDNGWYEWMIVDTSRPHTPPQSIEVGYGCAEIALRDALNRASA